MRDAALFVRGAAGEGDDFDAQLAAVPTAMDVLTLSLPSHDGDAEPFTAAAALARASAAMEQVEIGGGRVHLVGDGLGGILAQHAASFRPDLVASLVLIGSVPIRSPYYYGLRAALTAGGGSRHLVPESLIRPLIEEMAVGLAVPRDTMAEWSGGQITAAAYEIASLLARGAWPTPGAPTRLIVEDDAGFGLVGPLNKGWAEASAEVRRTELRAHERAADVLAAHLAAF